MKFFLDPAVRRQLRLFIPPNDELTESRRQSENASKRSGDRWQNRGGKRAGWRLFGPAIG